MKHSRKNIFFKNNVLKTLRVRFTIRAREKTKIICVQLLQLFIILYFFVLRTIDRIFLPSLEKKNLNIQLKEYTFAEFKVF